jgi:putative membrane protein
VFLLFGLNNFSFTELWSPWFALWMVFIVAIYFAVIGPLRSRFKGSVPVPAWRQFTFVLGAIVYYLAQGGPLDILSHLMFSMHMLSMALAFLVAPPLMLLGLPGWLFRPVIGRAGIAPVFRFLTHPLVTVLAFNALFSFYHLPLVHDFVRTQYLVHDIYYAVLLITAFMMWWPIIGPIPELVRLSELRKLAYVFANGVLITPACALIIFAQNPLYDTFNDPATWAQALGYCVPWGSEAILKELIGPETFAWLPPKDDQQLGGVLMKVLQEIIYGSALAYIFFNWYINEKKQDSMEPDPLPQ